MLCIGSLTFCTFGPAWGWPAEIFHGPARASGIAIFNTFGAAGRARQLDYSIQILGPEWALLNNQTVPVCCHYTHHGRAKLPEASEGSAEHIERMLPNLAGWGRHAERQATASLTEIDRLSR